MKTFVKVFCVLLLAMWINPLCAQDETPAQRDARMSWWREARFGMFIHWGPYAELGGVYDNKRSDSGVGGGVGEWIMYNAKIPVADYAREAAKFNPQKFDANAWVRLAKEAGQKYIIITAKHHDGFAMFQSKVTPFNLVDHTPFRRDVLKELAAACKKQGIRLGFYYSQAQDWHHAGGAAYPGGGAWYEGDPGKGHWDKAQDGSFDDYLDRIAIPQIRELLSNYGPVAAFWWDSPVGMNEQRAERLVPLLALQPGIITNNRLQGDQTKIRNRFSGDTETPEQTIPPTGFKDRDFEVCMTMNDTWGYKKYDDNWKPAKELIRKLVDVASKGGNFLLNVGPDGLGQIPQPSIERLKTVGKWTSANREAIYGTTASPFAKLPWGRCTQKPGILYLHVFDWPANGQLRVPGMKSAIRSARLLTNSKKLTVESVGDDKLIRLPANAPDSVVSVIRVELDGPLNVDNKLPSPLKNGTISLPLWMTDIHNPGYGAEARLGEDNGVPAIVGWAGPKSYLSWGFETTAPGRYEIVADISVSKPGTSLKLKIGKESVTTTLVPGKQPVVLGAISIAAAGTQELTLYPVAKGWEPVILRAVTLRPVALPVASALSSPVKTGVILVNHIGFPPNAAKHCVIPGPPEKEFTIHQLKDTKWTQVFAGVLTEGGNELEPGWVGDFSAVKEDGIYQVRCGSLRSRAFTVYPGVYDVPMRSLFNYFTWARCGNTTKSCTGPCHLDDGNLVGVGHRDFSGGYHQSSDQRKWPWGLNLGLMGLVQFGGLQKPHWDNGSIAEEVRWGCDYYQKIVREDGGMYDCVGLPLGSGPRDFYPSDPPAPALWNNIRHQAMAAEYFKDRDKAYAAKCRVTAERVWRYMISDKRPKGKYVAPAIPPRGHDDINSWFSEFYEGSSLELAHRIGAATQLYRVTKDAALLKDAARCASQLMELQVAESACFWQGTEGYRLVSHRKTGYFTDGTIGIRLAELILAAPKDKDAERWRATIKRMADQMVELSHRNPWGLTPSEFLVQDAPPAISKPAVVTSEGRYLLGNFKDRTTGSNAKIIAYNYRPYLYNMSIMEAALFLNRAAEITGDKSYSIVAQRQLDWVMGCNPFDASTIEGVGYNQPLRGLFGEFFPPTPQIPGAVSLGLQYRSFDPNIYGNSGANEYDMPEVGNVLWVMAEQAKQKGK